MKGDSQAMKSTKSKGKNLRQFLPTRETTASLGAVDTALPLQDPSSGMSSVESHGSPSRANETGTVDNSHVIRGNGAILGGPAERGNGSGTSGDAAAALLKETSPGDIKRKKAQIKSMKQDLFQIGKRLKAQECLPLLNWHRITKWGCYTAGIVLLLGVSWGNSIIWVLRREQNLGPLFWTIGIPFFPLAICGGLHGASLPAQHRFDVALRWMAVVLFPFFVASWSLAFVTSPTQVFTDHSPFLADRRFFAAVQVIYEALLALLLARRRTVLAQPVLSEEEVNKLRTEQQYLRDTLADTESELENLQARRAKLKALAF